MTVEKEIKKITLFPNEAHPLSEDALIDYIGPMEKLGFLPIVNKVVTIRINPKSGNVDKIDAWTIDFSHKENSLKVTVDVDRVTIETESGMDLTTMLDKAGPVVEIVINNCRSLSRLAIGKTIFGSANIEELRHSINISDIEINDGSSIEKTLQYVRVNSLKSDEDKELLTYNDVHIFKVIWHGEDFGFIDDYDVNTSIDSSPENVTSSLSKFFDEVVLLLENKNVSRKTTEDI